MDTTTAGASGPHDEHTDEHGHDHGGSDESGMAELLELDAEVLAAYLSELTGWLAELVDREPAEIVDLGSGPGTGAIALAQQFANAQVSAVDVSPQLLHRLSQKAEVLGLSDRVVGLEADLDQGWPTVEPVDLVWAASSLHHLADPDRVLAGAFDALRPGGLLAVTEMEFFPRFLPDDIGFGRPGLEERVHTALDTSPYVDWTDHLSRAGFELEAQRSFAIQLTEALPPAAGRYAQVCLQRMRPRLDDLLPAEDLVALDTLLDSESPDSSHSILLRDDLIVRSNRTTWVARRP